MVDAFKPRPLPKSVTELADRLGAQRISGGRAKFSQNGRLRDLGQEKWMRFTARQWADARTCAFQWRARVGPFGAVVVEDALIGGTPVGAVKALGLIPLDSAAPSTEMIKGQAMRYLAELPWVPDAILSNPHLEWENLGAGRLQVTTQISDITASIALQLGKDGLPHRIEGLRPARHGKTFVERPWYGEFADFREVQGRCIPHAGKVGWIVDDCPQDVWHGTITKWSMGRD